MATSEQPPKKKKPQRSSDDINLLKSEVASFASSLGLAPSIPGGGGGGGGFDDSDFRKSGPLKPPRTPKSLIPSNSSDLDASKSKDNKPPPYLKSKAKPHPLQIDPFPSSQKPSSKDKDKLPLMKASSLSGQWYTDAEELESKVLGSEGRKPPTLGVEAMKGLAERKKEMAERLMEQYSLDYESSRRKSGDMRLLETTARSGTSADKVSAFTCLVEDNPIANVRSLDALLAMVTSKVGKRYAFTGFDALKELFMLRLLPDRKLKCLIQRPLDKLPETKDGFSLLLFWYWEECLKQRYERFIIALEDALKDMLPNLKDKAMKTVYILLKSKSEQERRLLSALVNKLGDPERKAASSAGYHLSCLLSAHPNMKAVVINEVDSFLFRPHIGLRAKYQAVNFLSQILLTKRGDGPKIAKRLIDVYFALFKVLISENDGIKMRRKNERNDKKKVTNSLWNSKKEHSVESHVEMDSRLLSALLAGVNRAFPFVSSDEADDIIEVQTPLLFRLVHSENFNVGVQALMLLYQISSKNHITSDRFYRALYSKLLSPAAVNSSKPEMFLGLLVKAMKNDINLKRISAFSKRLLQVALHRPPQYACGCLFILSEVLKAKPPLWMMVLQKESGDDEIEHFEDIREDNEDTNIQPSTISASSGNFTAQSGKKLLIADQEKDHNILSSKAADDDDDPGQVQTPHMQSSLPGGYDPRHREPLYCNADHASWWELTILASHVHPSVATMARTLLSGINIVYNGDPLSDLSLNAFLDKFMEKKPKPNKIAEGRWHGGSQIAPAKKLDLNHHLIGDEMLELAEEEVPPEDVVFHRFYMNKTSSSKKSKKPKTKKKVSDDEDAEELISDASDNESEEEEIDDMLGSGHLPLTEDKEGDYDYDDLDRVIDEDDDDLLGNDSDGETTDHPLNEQKHKGSESDDDDDDDDEGIIDIRDDDATGNSDDGGSNDSSGDEGDKLEQTHSRKRRKSEGRSRPSPFASLEDYEHLLSNDDKGGAKKSKAQKKKRKTSS